jgi:hypothetical protein
VTFVEAGLNKNNKEHCPAIPGLSPVPPGTFFSAENEALKEVPLRQDDPLFWFLRSK